MTSTGTGLQDATERQRAVRTLLRDPVITTTTHPDELVLVRRHAAELQRQLGNLFGYALVVEASFARLVKDPLDAAAPVRPARRRDVAGDPPFTPRGYVVLALVAAAISAPRPGDQLLISTLVELVRIDGVSCGVEITDSLADRRHLVAAVAVLGRWGFLSETDGTAAAWAERQRPEALLTINRALLPYLLAQPLRALSAPHEAWATRPLDIPRRRLRRKLIENPLVPREDLTDDERDVLSRERTVLTQQFDELAGLILEVRAEGALLYDPSGGVTDVDFPGTGSLKQAALLLLDALVVDGAPGLAVDTSPEVSVAGVLAPWTTVDDVLRGLVARYAKAWRDAYVDDPVHLRADVVDLLVSLGLVVPLDRGLVIRPAAARYRAAPSRVQRPGAAIDDQPSLFTDDPENPEDQA